MKIVAENFATSTIQGDALVGRLHKARLLMLHDGLKASTAAIRVGYESASQFSREFKRLFGITPSDEIARLRDNSAIMQG